MDWQILIGEIIAAGATQAEIGAAIGKSQAWVSAYAIGIYRDMKWSDGEALRRLHRERVPSTPPIEREAA